VKVLKIHGPGTVSRKGEFGNVICFDDLTHQTPDDYLLPDGRIRTPMKYSALLHIPKVQLPGIADKNLWIYSTD
jgi:hypothetical protein